MSIPTILVMPTFDLLPEDILAALRLLAAAPVEVVNEEGEYVLSQIAEEKDATNLLSEDIVMIPLAIAAEALVDAGTYLAASPIMFVRLVGVPHHIMTYGTCVGFYGPVSVFPFTIGDRIKFPSMVGHYFVARPGVVEALLELMPHPHSTSEPLSKRVCARPLGNRGEQTEQVIETGTLKFINDLEGGRYNTRNKTDLEGRERDLNFLFRALDYERREYAMGVDYLLQTEKYRIMIVEEAETRTELRKAAFASCGLYDRVFNLRLFTDPVKLKLFLTGNVLSGDAMTVTLFDFMGSQQLSEGDIICPQQNKPLVDTLRNLQLVMQVLLSDHFKDSFEPFIFFLEGPLRPLELVKSNLLIFTVEESLRVFFKLVRSERTGSGPIVTSVRNPEECAVYLQSLFCKLKERLSDHQLRRSEEEYFEMFLSNKMQSNKKISATKTQTITIKQPKKVSSRPCTGFIGEQLKAVLADGARYTCAFGSDCVFRHVTIKGKSQKEMSELFAQLPALARTDFRKVSKTQSSLHPATSGK
jgi:hypothetical protein